METSGVAHHDIIFDVWCQQNLIRIVGLWVNKSNASSSTSVSVPSSSARFEENKTMDSFNFVSNFDFSRETRRWFYSFWGSTFSGRNSITNTTIDEQEWSRLIERKYFFTTVYFLRRVHWYRKKSAKTKKKAQTREFRSEVHEKLFRISASWMNENFVATFQRHWPKPTRRDVHEEANYYSNWTKPTMSAKCSQLDESKYASVAGSAVGFSHSSLITVPMKLNCKLRAGIFMFCSM